MSNMIHAVLMASLFSIAAADSAFSQSACRFRVISTPSVAENRDGAFQIVLETGQKTCQSTFTSGGRANFEYSSIAISKNASNGAVVQKGFGFIYTAKAGFSGNDQFILKLCGKSDRGTGCANVTYSAVVP